MELTQLIDIAYERGCNSSADAAKRTRRYRELTQQFGQPARAPQRALIQHLGESLIAAADANLPLGLKRRAGQWHKQTHDQQLDNLDSVLDTLTSRQWHKLRGKTKVRPNDWGRGALPAECGSWETGPHRPCCHGIGMMLMAWAKRTGAPHYWANLLQTTTMASIGIVLQQIDEFKRLIAAQLPEFNQQATRVHRWLEAVEVTLYGNYAGQERFAFHATLVIQMSDGRWVMLDPYLQTADTLDAEFGWNMAAAHRSLRHSRPERVLAVNSAAAIELEERQWHRQQQLITRHLEQLRRRHLANPDLEHPLDVGNMVMRFLRSAAAKKAGLVAAANVHPRLIASYGLLSHRMKMTEVTPRKFKRAWNRMLADDTLRHLATQRAASGPPISWLVTAVLEGQDKLTKDIPYASLELANPATAAATGTLNNLRCWLGSKPYSLGGELLPYSESQVLWHDHQLTMLAGQNLDARHQALLRDREEKLRELPAISRHPMVQTLLDALSTQLERQ